jgi:hypothetical protein
MPLMLMRISWFRSKERKNTASITERPGSFVPICGFFIPIFSGEAFWTARKAFCIAFLNATGNACWWMPRSMNMRKPAVSLVR